MIVRNCAGGVVFCGNKIFLLKNDKNEWGLPKGAIREKRSRRETALLRVKIEAGIEAKILCAAGDTSYEFYSFTRRQPVCNRIHWYVMTADTEEFCVSAEEGFTDGGFFPMEEAIERVTYTKEKELVQSACEKYLAELNG